MAQLNEIQRAARNLPGHWYQGDTSDGKGNYCGIGHVLQVMEMPTDAPSVNRDLAEKVRQMVLVMDEAAGDKFPDRGEEFAAFNDHHDTTEDEVIAVMELAGERWAIEHDQCV